MPTPHKCPICLGKGEIGPRKAKHDANPIKVIHKGNGRDRKIFVCHGCLGTGILWDGNSTSTPWQIYPPTIVGSSITWSNKGSCQGIVNPQNNPFLNDEDRADMNEALEQLTEKSNA